MGGSLDREKEEREEVRKEIDKRHKEMEAELSQQEPIITENVIEQLSSDADTTVVRYSELKNRSKIAGHIKETFKHKNGVEFFTEAAENMSAVFRSSNEMKGMQRWNHVQKIIKCGDMTVGMELHYKVVVTEEKVGASSYGRGRKTDTVVILGYKFFQHVLDIDPKSLPDDEKLKALRF